MDYLRRFLWEPSRRSLVFLVVSVAGMTAVGAPKAQAPARSVASPAPTDLRSQFLQMAARGYFPGRSGQIVIVPRQGHIMTRDDPEVPFMHGSPWPYDTEIPMLFAGPMVQPGRRDAPAVQQDVAVTLATALRTRMPITATGRVLPVLRPNAPMPRAVVLIVLDGMRRDYFDRYAAQLPTLASLRKRSAWFPRARVNYIPTNTGVGHSTIATGTDPRVHGITGNNLFDSVARKRYDIMQGWNPRDLMALTLADVWQLETRGRAVVIAQGGSVPSATAMGGHGGCQLNGAKTILAGYDQNSGRWSTNNECYTLPSSVAAMDAKTLWPADGRWMGHKIDSPSAVRRSGLFVRFEADALIGSIESSSMGADDVPDVLMLNYKPADFVGHKHGPASEELKTTLKELDTHLARILAAIEGKVGKGYLLAITGDHGMPSEPRQPADRHLAGSVVDLIHDRFDRDTRALVTYYEPENAQIFIDMDRLAQLKVSLKDIAKHLEAQPFVFAAFTQDDVRRTVAPNP